ncbi:hypothetical protein KAW65_02690 [candidate division WOR-3 bacterium]|nr:hypothetical protein [candidate division WOR-3 bacterium]
MRITILIWTIIIFLLVGCNKLNHQYKVTIPVNKEIVADGVGDHNGIASEDELKFIEEYFNSDPEAWCMGYFPLSYAGKTQIPADTVLWAFKQNSLAGPYKSETELREAFKGVNIRTPCVGVYVLILDEECEITHLFRAPGPQFSKSEWIQMKVVLGG